MNLKFEGEKRVIFYRSLVRKIEPQLVSASFSAEELLSSLIDYLQKKKRYILLTIDEVDYFVKRFHKERVIYDLTRLNEIFSKPGGIVGVTFIARERNFHKFLDPAELSTLGRTFIEFKPYSSKQIYEILKKRAEEAFNRGKYSHNTLQLIADITASKKINSDLRYALDLLLYSGILANNQGSERVLLDHVRKVTSQISSSLTSEELHGMPDKSRIVLLAIVRSLNENKPYTSLNKIRNNVGIVCEELGVPPIENIEEVVQDLWDRQIVNLKSLMEIGINNAPVEDLGNFLSSLIKRLRNEVNQKPKQNIIGSD